MPDQAFSKILSMAGPEIPARHQTLNHILTQLLGSPVDHHKLAAAIKAEPLLLIQFINRDGLNQWADSIDETLCLERVLMLANQIQPDASGRAWQRSRLAAELAEKLAGAAGYEQREIERCRLLASLLDIGHQQLPGEAFYVPREDQQQQELEKFGETGAAYGARLLSALGCKRQDCDILRYQYEGLDVLAEASKDLILIALAGRLADAMLTDFELASQYFELIEQRLDIPGAAVSELLEQAYGAFRAANDALLGLGNFDGNLARGNLVQQIRLCKDQDSLVYIGRQVFGFEAIHYAAANNDTLSVDISDEPFTFSTDSGASLITKAFQSQHPFSAEERALVAIVDKQILSRLATSALWLIPLGSAGVAICPTNVSAPELDQAVDPLLLQVFANACRTQLVSNPPATAAMIEVDQVQRQVRELTHEVNNPLAIVQNYLKTLSLKLGPDSAAQPDIETISREMLRIGGIISKYGRIGVASDEALQPMDLNAMLESLSSVFRGSHPDIQFPCELDPAMPMVMGRADELKQVVLNLLKNAAEALIDRQDGRVMLATNSKMNLGGSRYVEVIVEDNGPGIRPEIYERLFSTNNSSKGRDHSGLGLSVANRLITEMGGLISCKTSEASGTRFQILLPVENVTEPAG